MCNRSDRGREAARFRSFCSFARPESPLGVSGLAHSYCYRDIRKVGRATRTATGVDQVIAGVPTCAALSPRTR